jgi:hypothetical protein
VCFHRDTTSRIKAAGMLMNTLNPGTEEMPEDTKWAKFWETSGILPAEVIAGRLRAEGIPAWTWQQGAGAAMGLTYGPLGRGHVMVPEEQLDQARRIMATDFSPEVDDEELWDESDPAGVDFAEDRLSKGALALIALAVSPLGVAAAFIIAKLFGGREEFDLECPDCEITVDLNEEEKTQGWFICPECGRTVLTN